MVSAVEDDGTNPFSSAINLITQSRNATKGPSLFVFKAIVVSTSSAVVFGLGAGLLAPPALGSGLATLMGMGAGFVGGLVHRWRTDLSHATNAMDEFPELMQFHIKQILMHSQYLPAHVAIDLQTWRKDLQGNMAKQSAAIAAVYSAGDALQTIWRHQEEQIIEQYMAQATAKITEQFESL